MESFIYNLRKNYTNRSRQYCHKKTDGGFQSLHIRRIAVPCRKQAVAPCSAKKFVKNSQRDYKNNQR